MKYTLTLADGTCLTGFSKNGDNFVSTTEVDEGIFENNLSKMIVSDGETETTYYNVELIAQRQWFDGTYYLAFREMADQEIREATINAKIDYLAMMSDIDLEEV